jgi:hypothetical protein
VSPKESTCIVLIFRVENLSETWCVVEVRFASPAEACGVWKAESVRMTYPFGTTLKVLAWWFCLLYGKNLVNQRRLRRRTSFHAKDKKRIFNDHSDSFWLACSQLLISLLRRLYAVGLTTLVSQYCFSIQGKSARLESRAETLCVYQFIDCH